MSLLSFLKRKTADDFYARIGFGDISYTQITGAMGLIIDRHKSDLKLKIELENVEEKSAENQPKRKAKRQKGLVVEGLEGIAYHMANCCMPMPPEPIKGYITRGRGVTVHRVTCAQFHKIALAEPARIIDVGLGNGRS